VRWRSGPATGLTRSPIVRCGPRELELAGTLGAAPLPAGQVIADLVAQSEPGLTAINSPRFFGFVMGGAHAAAIAADWLT
jgi:hypothetical protein